MFQNECQNDCDLIKPVKSGSDLNFLDEDEEEYEEMSGLEETLSEGALDNEDIEDNEDIDNDNDDDDDDLDDDFFNDEIYFNDDLETSPLNNTLLPNKAKNFSKISNNFDPKLNKKNSAQLGFNKKITDSSDTGIFSE